MTARLTRIALLTATALILFLVESALPRPLPWMRLGLANAPVLAALMLFGAGPAIAIAAAKWMIGGLLSGGLAGPAFVIGGAGGMASVTVMVVLRHTVPRWFSPVGISIAGALAHQSVQLIVASGYLGTSSLLSLWPMFLVGGVLSGTLTGVATYVCIERLRRHHPDSS